MASTVGLHNRRYRRGGHVVMRRRINVNIWMMVAHIARERARVWMNEQLRDLQGHPLSTLTQCVFCSSQRPNRSATTDLSLPV